MTNQRDDHQGKDAPRPGGAVDEHQRSREGDPRKRDQQGVRTTGERDSDRPDDDPNRAPESGTP
ncbi:MAG: hypothetical protein M3Q11_06675 [Pseudomonadota bacterium]|nr:hypothetical protein [Pseudomonadota bacterium]